MPNGGSDCCGTCNFNRKNRGVAGYGGRDNPETPHCEIRDFPIRIPFYTYCANHPHHNPDGLRVPIGPVKEGEDREVILRAPDTPEIRDALLAVLAAATPDSGRRYPAGLSAVEAAALQLAEFREVRCLPHLDRLRGYAAVPPTPDDGRVESSPPRLARIAEEALRQWLPPESFAPFGTEAVRLLADGIRSGGHFDRLPVLADALDDAGYADAGVLHYLRASAVGPNWVADALAAGPQ